MDDLAPYLRIAAELRARIDSGKLAPGARLPSTRALARRHRVALATAAHALKVLLDEGRTKSMPRVGTVVAAQRSASPELSRAAIVAAAVQLVDDEGIEALSMRSLAARLGAAPMSIYRHVRGKEELLSAMSEAVMAEHMNLAPTEGGFREQLEVLARGEWKMLRRHPWLARVVNVTRPQARPAAMTFVNAVMRALDPTGLRSAEKLRLHVQLHTFAQGLAMNIEEEVRARSETGLTEDEWMKGEEPKFTAMAATGPYPHFAKVLAEMEGFDLDFDVLFETGLKVFLDGIEVMVKRRAAKR
jgi:DNA-binding transcriptional regulator YhcF (GntR family)